jgi:hypothetical protein
VTASSFRADCEDGERVAAEAVGADEREVKEEEEENDEAVKGDVGAEEDDEEKEGIEGVVKLTAEVRTELGLRRLLWT